MLDKQLQELPQETIKRIRTDAARWNENQYGNDDVNDDYLEGALHEAELAQSATQRIEQLEKALKEIQAEVTKAEKESIFVDEFKIRTILANILTPKTGSDE